MGIGYSSYMRFFSLFLAAVSLHAGILTLGSFSPVSSVEGSPFSGTIATIDDTNQAELASSLSGTIAWGDATSSAPVVVSEGGGVFGIMGTHTYAEEGAYGISLALNDGVGDNLNASLATAMVADASLSVLNLPPSFNFTPGILTPSLVLVTFGDGDTSSSPSDFTATINWGDGGTSFGTISSLGSGVYDLAGAHTYAAPGTFTVALSVNDVGGSVLTAQTQADSSAPEPGTIGTVCVGLGLAAMKRRRRLIVEAARENANLVQ
jgi:PKD repeat protein